MNILNEEYIYTQRNGLLSALLFFLMFIFLIFAVIFLAETYFRISLFFFVFAILYATSGIYCSKKIITDKKQYEVILDDDYPASILYDNYEIIERRGEIWILQDKEIK